MGSRENSRFSPLFVVGKQIKAFLVVLGFLLKMTLFSPFMFGRI